MIRMRSIVFLPIALILVACASGRHEKAPAVSDGPLAALPGQDLAAGECGLFLWTVQAPRRLIFFRKAGEARGQLALGEDILAVTSIEETGRVFGQFMTHVTYNAKDGQTVTIKLVPGEEVEDGQRTQSAQILVRNRTDWETMMPAAGLMACVPMQTEGR